MGLLGKGDHSTGLRPYERGLSLKAAARGAIARFLPASIASMTGIAVALDATVSGGALELVSGVMGFSTLMTLGFGAGLLAMRRRLYPDAEIDGRRAVLAGVLSPLALFIPAALSGGMSYSQVVLTLFTVGVLLAVGLFFPWLTPTPADSLSNKYLIGRDEGSNGQLGPAS